MRPSKRGQVALDASPAVRRNVTQLSVHLPTGQNAEKPTGSFGFSVDVLNNR
jgi:hypothetical protein